MVFAISFCMSIFFCSSAALAAKPSARVVYLTMPDFLAQRCSSRLRALALRFLRAGLSMIVLVRVPVLLPIRNSFLEVVWRRGRCLGEARRGLTAAGPTLEDFLLRVLVRRASL